MTSDLLVGWIHTRRAVVGPLELFILVLLVGVVLCQLICHTSYTLLILNLLIVVEIYTSKLLEEATQVIKHNFNLLIKGC